MLLVGPSPLLDNFAQTVLQLYKTRLEGSA
jgi:hypothetical protein